MKLDGFNLEELLESIEEMDKPENHKKQLRELAYKQAEEIKEMQEEVKSLKAVAESFLQQVEIAEINLLIRHTQEVTQLMVLQNLQEQQVKEEEEILNVLQWQESQKFWNGGN